MKTLEEIQNEESVNRKYRDWNNLVVYGCRDEIILVMNLSAKIYAKECVKASLEKASEIVAYKYNDSYECKKSITQESNIILL